jgi:HK97 family phage prohead protease
MAKVRLKVGEKAITSMPVSVKAIDKENFRLTMVASTQDVDRHGDTVLQAGWDIKPFGKNPVILNSHNYYDATEVIARAENTRVEGKGKRAKLIQEWVFAVNENPKAKIIFDLYAGGFLHASSVGFIPRKFAEKPDGSRDWFVIEQAELLEVSAVSVPANAMALAKSKGIAVDELPEEMIDEDEIEDDGAGDKDHFAEAEEMNEEEETEETGEDEETAEDEEVEPDPEEQEPEVVTDSVADLPAFRPTKSQLQKKAAVRVLHSLNDREEKALRATYDTIGKMLHGDKYKNLDRRTRQKAQRRDYNSDIRRLLKGKR